MLVSLSYVHRKTLAQFTVPRILKKLVLQISLKFFFLVVYIRQTKKLRLATIRPDEFQG